MLGGPLGSLRGRTEHPGLPRGPGELTRAAGCCSTSPPRTFLLRQSPSCWIAYVFLMHVLIEAISFLCQAYCRASRHVLCGYRSIKTSARRTPEPEPGSSCGVPTQATGLIAAAERPQSRRGNYSASCKKQSALRGEQLRLILKLC